MIWVEEIRIRTAINKKESAHQYLIKTAVTMRNKKGLIDAEVYSCAQLENDFSIRLIWNTDSFKCPGSEEGMNLRESLKQFGLVNYSVWIGENSKFNRFCLEVVELGYKKSIFRIFCQMLNIL